MEKSIKRKINIFGKVAKIITTIFIVLLMIAEGFMLVGGIIVAALPKDVVTVDAAVAADVKIDTSYFGMDGDEFYVNLGDSQVKLGKIGSGDAKVINNDGVMNADVDIRDLHFDLNTVLLLIIYGFIAVAAIIVALYFFKALMKQFMICDSPFCDGVVQKMRAFAIALIPCMVVIQGMKSAISAFISDSFTFDIDFVSAAFVFIIFVLTMIFKYGAALQKEHDETV